MNANWVIGAILCAISAPAVDAAVIVVDAAAGPHSGVFTTIQGAVLAGAPGDTILVRSGNYPPFKLNGKGLSVIADAGAVVNVLGICDSSYVHSVPANQPVLIRGIRFNPDWCGAGGSATVFESFLVANCAGPVCFDSCVFENGAPALWVFNSTNVTVQRSSLMGIGFYDENIDNHGAKVTNSVVAFTDCSLTGGHGGSPGSSYIEPCFLTDSKNGGDGLRVVGNSVATVTRCALVGGDGASGNPGPSPDCCRVPSDGGNGLQLMGNAQGVPLVRAIDCTFDFGLAGQPALPCGSAVDGVSTKVVAGSLVSSSTLAPSLSDSSPTREGQSIQVDVQGVPGDLISFLIAPSSSSVYLPAGVGPLLVSVPFTAFVFGSIPPGGALSANLTIAELGPGIESVTVFAQVLGCGTSGCRLGGGGTIVLLDSSF